MDDPKSLDLSKLPSSNASDGIRRIIERLIASSIPSVIYVFGSRARGDFNEDSDLDVCVLIEDDRAEKRFDLSTELSKTISPDIELEVDIVTMTKESFAEGKNKPYLVAHSIAKDGVMVYSRGPTTKPSGS